MGKFGRLLLGVMVGIMVLVVAEATRPGLGNLLRNSPCGTQKPIHQCQGPPTTACTMLCRVGYTCVFDFVCCVYKCVPSPSSLPPPSSTSVDQCPPSSPPASSINS